MRPSELKAKLDEVGLCFDEIVLLEMVQDMKEEIGGGEGRGFLESDGVRVTDVMARAHNLRFSSSKTVHKYMGNLNRRSYLRREIDDHDNRVVRVSVTGLGKNLLEDIEG